MNSIKTLMKWFFISCLLCSTDNLVPMMTLRQRKSSMTATKKTKLLPDTTTEGKLSHTDFIAELEEKRRQFIRDFQPENYNRVLFYSRPIIIAFDNLSLTNFIGCHVGYSGALDSTMLIGYETKPGESKHAVFNAAPIFCNGNTAFLTFRFENSIGKKEYLLIGITLKGNFYSVTPKVFVIILPEFNVQNPEKIAIIEKELQAQSIEKQYFNMVRKGATEKIHNSLQHKDFTLQYLLATEPKKDLCQISDYIVLHIILQNNN